MLVVNYFKIYCHLLLKMPTLKYIKQLFCLLFATLRVELKLQVFIKHCSMVIYGFNEKGRRLIMRNDMICSIILAS